MASKKRDTWKLVIIRWLASMDWPIFAQCEDCYYPVLDTRNSTCCGSCSLRRNKALLRAEAKKGRK